MKNFMLKVLTSFHLWVTVRVLLVVGFAMFLSSLVSKNVWVETLIVALFYYIYQTLKARWELMLERSLVFLIDDGTGVVREVSRNEIATINASSEEEFEELKQQFRAKK